MIDLLLVAWISLGLVHLGVPLGYFGWMRRIASSSTYKLNLDENQEPKEPTVSILIPAYNEETVIERKLENIAGINYPTEKIEVIVVDGASTDNTVALATKFLRFGPLKGRVVEESERRGKSSGLNSGGAFATGSLICISDAECQWDREALRNAARYFSDPSIGAVSGVHELSHKEGSSSQQTEHAYRSVYRTLRIAESKLHSTPVGEGEIQLFRRAQLTGFDPTLGGDDTAAALRMVKQGLRAISADDVVFFEPTPSSWRERFRQKIRRGQHVLQAFVRYRGLLFGKSKFSRIIFPAEFFLYVVNPLLFVPFLVLTLWLSTSTLILGTALAGALVLALLLSATRTIVSAYFANNLTMLAAIFQELRGEKQLKWTKIDENRPRVKEIAPVQR